MTMQITALGSEPDRVIGYLSWWTLRQNEHDAHELRESAAREGVPSWIIDRLNGRTPESAWLTATQLGSSGVSIPSPDGKEDELWRVVTRDYPNGDPAIRSRALVVEVSRRDAPTTSETVSSKTAAIVHFANGNSWNERAEWVDYLQDIFTQDAIADILRSMENKAVLIEGKIDDGRIRSAVLAWLRMQHRVS